MSFYPCSDASGAETGFNDFSEWCAVGFKMRNGAKLIVEARDSAAAKETFTQVLRRDGTLKGKTAKLAPNLFFAQAEATGNYWIFTQRGSQRLGEGEG